MTNFRTFRSKLKTECISNKKGNSCLSAAVFADFENDNILFATFLKQGCSYGHSESCFYLNLEMENREKQKEQKMAMESASARAYRESVLNHNQAALNLMLMNYYFPN